MARQSLRFELAKRLVELGGRFPEIVVLEGDLKESTQSIQFQKAFPERYFDIGVAEQNMVGIAAGLALEGKIPVVHSFATFISLRACEQVRTSVAYPNLNVKFVGTHAGLSTGTAGTTHHAIEDLAIMRAIPNMMVLVPGDAEEARQCIEAALAVSGPVYIRLPAGEADDVYGPGHAFAIGRATLLRPGSDATIITTGVMACLGLQAAEILEREKGISARVLQMASVKPIDREAIERAAAETGLIVTVEEHNVLGGLGGAICEIAAEPGNARVIRLGIQDRFAGVGSLPYLLDQERLHTAQVVDIITRTKANG